jgi:hypothetical protein
MTPSRSARTNGRLTKRPKKSLIFNSEPRMAKRAILMKMLSRQWTLIHSRNLPLSSWKKGLIRSLMESMTGSS